MLLYYALQYKDGGLFPDHGEIWMVDFPTSSNIEELTEQLALWHSLKPSSMTLLDSVFNKLLDEESDLSHFRCSVDFPLIVAVSKQNEKTGHTVFPMTHVLYYLLTRDKKYKPIIACT
jgi:hypothetical protein